MRHSRGLWARKTASYLPDPCTHTGDGSSTAAVSRLARLVCASSGWRWPAGLGPDSPLEGWGRPRKVPLIGSSLFPFLPVGRGSFKAPWTRCEGQAQKPRCWPGEKRRKRRRENGQCKWKPSWPAAVLVELDAALGKLIRGSFEHSLHNERMRHPQLQGGSLSPFHSK